MIRYMLAISVLLAAAAAPAQMVRQRWAGEGVRCTYPKAMQALRKEDVPRLLFDLSALPKDAKVFHASLCNPSVRQPGKTIRIHLVEKLDAGKAVLAPKPLELEKPAYRSFDATEAVRLWVAQPDKNLGLGFPAAESFDLPAAYLEIAWQGQAKDLPEPVGGLTAVHHDGQTFLTWKELPRFVPPSEQVFWIDKFGTKGPEVAAEPGKGYRDYPRLAAIRLGELRRMQMIQVIDPPKGTQDYPKLVRQEGWPDIQYRLYRSGRKITPETLQDAQLIGQADVLCAYDESMRVISSRGEYYDKREVAESVIPTYCIAEGKSVAPGHAFYVHTPQEAGSFFYAVTVVQDGTENTAAITAANSLQEPVAEKPAPIKPVFQYIHEHDYRERHYTDQKYYCWPAPPSCNIPFQEPLAATLHVQSAFKGSGGLHIGPLDALPEGDYLALSFDDRFSHGGHLAYNQGLGTFLATNDSKVDYYSERYMLYLAEWIFGRFQIDRKRVQTCGLYTAFALRHPELIKLHRSGSYEIDFDLKFNHAAPSLGGMFGDPELAKTVDGHKAWDITDIAWYLRTFPERDTPYFVATHGGKESGHAIEYGWQDDPKGWAALRDGRQCFVGAWGGGRIDAGLWKVLSQWPADKSMPAFSNCSMDDYPGNGDPADGDTAGQINGFLAWEYETVVERPDHWGMTVFVGSSAGTDACTVDVTPRHCKTFKPKPAQKFKWANTSLAGMPAGWVSRFELSGGRPAGGEAAASAAAEAAEAATQPRPVASGAVEADRWGLVTLKQVAVTKGRNRIVIAAE